MANEFIAVQLDLFTHPKFLHLTRLIDPNTGGAAVWLLKYWVWVARHAPSGSFKVSCPSDVEQAIGWDETPCLGAPERYIHCLSEALEKSGFIEVVPIENDRWEIAVHDWQEWQPFWAGKAKQSEAGRRGAEKRWGGDRVGMGTPLAPHTTNQDGVGMAPPMATRTRTETKEKKQKPMVNGEAVDRWRNWFMGAFWRTYPRKKAKQDAEKAWMKLRPDDPEKAKPLCSMILTALDRDIEEEWVGWPPDKIPYPATWLRRESFAEADVLEGEP